MQIKNNSSFLKSFMVGLIASSAGAFVALPSSAMPEATEVNADSEVMVPVEALTEPMAEEALPMTEMEAADTEATDVEVSTEETEEVAAEGVTAEEMPVADEAMAEEMPVADEEIIEEPVAEEEAIEEPVAEEEIIEEPVADEEIIEEPVAEEEIIEEPVADEEIIEEPVAEEEAIEEPVAEEEIIEEPVAEEEAIEEPVAEEEMTEEVEAPVAEESLETSEEEATAAEEMNTEDFTIAELTGNSDSFEILAAALEAAGLSETLGGEGPFTVFAPTDEAFEALPEGSIEQLLLPENKEVLIQILTYHVVAGAVLSADLETGAVATVEGSDLAVEVAETVTVNNANVIAADVAASNGIIHVVDSVILPPAPKADAEPAEDTASVQ